MSLGNTMAAIPKFDEANLRALSEILGDTDTGLTGSEIGQFLRAFEEICGDVLGPDFGPRIVTECLA